MRSVKRFDRDSGEGAEQEGGSIERYTNYSVFKSTALTY